MKVFVAGAAGAIGTQRSLQLVARGHDVVGMTRWRNQARRGCAHWAPGRSWPTRSTPTRSGVAVAEAEPEIVVHQLSALVRRAEHASHRPLLRDDQPTAHRGNRPPARLPPQAVGARRFVAQSYAGWPFARTRRSGQELATTRSIRIRRPRCASALDAIRYLETACRSPSPGPRASSCATAPSTGPGMGITSDPEGSR